MRKKISLVVAIMATTLCTGSAAIALETPSSRDRERTVLETQKQVESSVKTVTNGDVERAESTVKEQVISHREQIDARKAELKQKLEAKTDARKQKLEGRRLAQCQNRQDRINELMVKSSDVSNRHLENIQKFEASVTTFAEKKSINSEAYVTQLAKVDANEVIAEDAIKITASQQFDCLAVDAQLPAGTLKTAREEKRGALRDYRQSVIDLIKIVKQEFAQTQASKEEE